MESNKSQNKWTIGKYLRKKKNLRKCDITYEPIETPPELQAYMDYLLQRGAKINKVKLGRFHLKNGLDYTGLVANEVIFSNETLVQIPQKLLLTTKKAYFSDLRKVFIENPKFFSSKYSNSWEDRMLLMYLLYEYQKGEQSEWYHLLNNLPKCIDYVIFWDDQELKNLEDNTLYRIAKRYHKEYEEEKDYIISLCKKYPDLLDTNIYTPDNIRWIYTQLVTRCFGKYLEYVTMVPFAELLNHDNSDVFYDMKYENDNPHAPSEPFDDNPKPLEEGIEDEFDTSDGSYNSYDEEFDSDYEYEFDNKNKKASSNYALDDLNNSLGFVKLNPKKSIINEIGGDISNRIDEIENLLLNEIDLGDTFSVYYVYEIMKKLKALKEDYLNGKVKLQIIRNGLKEIEAMNMAYKFNIHKYYMDVLDKKEEDIRISQQENLKKMGEKDDDDNEDDDDDKSSDDDDEKTNTKENKINEDIQMTNIDYNGNNGNNEKVSKTDNRDNNAKVLNMISNGDEKPIKFHKDFKKDEDWLEDKFDYFIMKTSYKDQFEKNSQVYFCYGRLSNRLMLLRYGMALEYNKYEHIYIKIPYTNEFLLKIVQGSSNENTNTGYSSKSTKNGYAVSATEYILDKIKYFNINKWKRFKLKWTEFNIDLITYCKAIYWTCDKHTIPMLLNPINYELELLGLSKAISYIEEFLSKFSKTIEENEKLLEDNTLSYHGYFATVYRLERQRVARFHLKGAKIIIEIIKMIMKGIHIKEACKARVKELENEEEYYLNRNFLKKYLDRLILTNQKGASLSA